MSSRRDFLITMGLLTAGGVVRADRLLRWSPTQSLDFQLPKLPYAYKDLAPAIDARTMEIHHTKHHQAYVNNLNKAVVGTAAEGKNLEAILAEVSKYPLPVRNNAGGHYNHSLFWTLLQAPKTDNLPKGKLLKAIKKQFGSYAAMQKVFEEAATKRFGSGWAWLVVNDGKLQIGSTPNQDNPLMDVSELKGAPILALDVWEHAYYLNYQNKRADYAKTFWQVVNWQKVTELYMAATPKK